ncbi:hypothetical protein ACV3UL_14020, partial [Clostridium perfringens]
KGIMYSTIYAVFYIIAIIFCLVGFTLNHIISKGYIGFLNDNYYDKDKVLSIFPSKLIVFGCCLIISVKVCFYLNISIEIIVFSGIGFLSLYIMYLVKLLESKCKTFYHI